VKQRQALLASILSTGARMTSRVVRPSVMPTAEPWHATLMRLPSKWLGIVRVATSAGRLAIAQNVGGGSVYCPAGFVWFQETLKGFADVL